jgi:hypothetical protein
MSFFSALEPPPALPWAPPRNRIPVPVAWQFMLVRTEDTAVAVTNFSASPEGVQFSLVTLLQSASSDDEDGPFGGGSPAGLRFGLRLPDGSRVDRGRARDQQQIPVPPGFHLSSLGGSAGAGMWQQDLWLWPLPGPGTISFACAWPDRGAQEVVAEASTEELRHAAARADELWPLPPLTTRTT